MNIFKVLILGCFFNCLFFGASAQKQHALIVAIGEYPSVPEQKKNWSDLSSKNDADILQKAMLKQGFQVNHIHVISDSLATKKNIDLAPLCPVYLLKTMSIQRETKGTVLKI